MIKVEKTLAVLEAISVCFDLANSMALIYNGPRSLLLLSSILKVAGAVLVLRKVC